MTTKFYALQYTYNTKADNQGGTEKFVYADNGIALFPTEQAAKAKAEKLFGLVDWMTDRGWTYCGNYGTEGTVSVVAFEMVKEDA
jgi:hypothetical protein